MRPLLVVKHKRRAWGSTEEESTAWNLGVTVRASGGLVSFAQPRTSGLEFRADANLRRRIAQCLTSVCDGLRVHVFMQESQANEIRFVIAIDLRARLGTGRLTVLCDTFQDALNVSKRLSLGGKWEIPTGVVGNAGGIVEAVPVGPSRRFLSEVAHDPVFLEPRYVRDLPA